ncbi:MAG: hypothetical protein NT075_14195 [Chloroflexi bacterium]|nr:hypothetical protein [Chloroflexota bacterium]
MATIRTELQQKAQSVILQYAIFRWESAIVVAVTIILTFLLPKPFAWWPGFGWPLIGVVGVVALVYSSLIDADTNARVLLSQFQEQFDPRTIKDKNLRQQVENGLEYQRRIEMQVRKQRAGMIRDKLEETANQLTDWLSNIYQLAVRLDAYRSDDLLLRERGAVPKEIEQLTAQQRLESNPAVKQQLQDVLTSKAKHWQSLRDLDTRMQQAALQMDQSLTSLATIYSQVQLVDAQGIESGRTERLQADIREQVDRLNDLVSSINEVYDYNTKGIGT